MKSLKSMTNSQLSSMASATQAEIAYRAAVKKATAEVHSVLKKYKVKLDDLIPDGSLTTRAKGSDAKKQKGKTSNASVTQSKLSKPKTTTTKQDRRAVVKPKYKDPQSSKSWSGRGRAPQWVVEICEAKKISISEFKNDKCFSTF